jgi:hypothetical protein
MGGHRPSGLCTQAIAVAGERAEGHGVRDSPRLRRKETLWGGGSRLTQRVGQRDSPRWLVEP